MNKQKLIGLITKKQSYKDTKPIQNDILRKKDQAVNVSIAAIHQILKDDYNAESKLYAVRYLKDCFEKGNDLFITKTEEKILPILLKIVKDSENQEAVMGYGGSYTKAADLEKFKAIVTSLFMMSYQCVEKWAIWLPDRHGFVKAQKEVAKLKKVARKEQFTYFRAENQEIFRQNCVKNGVALASSSSTPLQKQTIPQKPQPNATKTGSSDVQNHPQAQSNNSVSPSSHPLSQPNHKYKSMTKISTILQQTQQRLKKQHYFNEKELKEVQAKFNAAVNQYIQEASQFDENYLEGRIGEFQGMKDTHQRTRKDKLMEQSDPNKHKLKEKQREKEKQKEKQKQKQRQKQREKQKKVQEPLIVQYRPPQQSNQIVQNPTFQNINPNPGNTNTSNTFLPQNSKIKAPAPPPVLSQVTTPIPTPKIQQPKVVILPIQSIQKSNHFIDPKQGNLQMGKSGIDDDQRVRFQETSQQEEEDDYSQRDFANRKLLPSKLSSQAQQQPTSKITTTQPINNGKQKQEQKPPINTTIGKTNPIPGSKIAPPTSTISTKVSPPMGNPNSNLSSNIGTSKPSTQKPLRLIPEQQFQPPKIHTSSVKQNQDRSLQVVDTQKNSMLSNNGHDNSNSNGRANGSGYGVGAGNEKNSGKNSQIASESGSGFGNVLKMVNKNQQNQYMANQFQQSQQQLDNLTKKYEYETMQLTSKLQRLQKQLQILKQKQSKYTQPQPQSQSEYSLSHTQKSNPNNKQLQALHTKLKKQQQDKSKMNQEILMLKAELANMRRDFDRSREDWRAMQSQDVSVTHPADNYLNTSQRPSNTSKLSNYKIKKITPIQQPNHSHNHNQSPILPTYQPSPSPSLNPNSSLNPHVAKSPRIEQDYLNNLTTYQKISSWLTQKNVLSFKLSILGLGQQFYSDQYVRIYRMQHVFTQNGAVFLRMTFSYQFARNETGNRDRGLKILYRNIAEVDFWTKPVSKANQVYSQETIARLCLVPLKIMKGTIYFGQNHNKSVTFLLPFIYYSYLQPTQFDASQLHQILRSKSSQVLKSKVFHLNPSISNPTLSLNLTSIFKGSIQNNQYLEMCLREVSEERVFLVQVEVLKNQKAVIRVLPIPADQEMVVKGREIVGNLVFLLGA